MRVAVAFQNEGLEFDVPHERLIAQWHGPAGASESETVARVAEALETPADFPPLRQAVVPGDRVALAFDGAVSHARPVLDAIAQILRSSGVDAESIAVVVPPGGPLSLAASLPPGLSLIVHDPEDRKQLAYLAATAQGRRIYLNRHLVDADFVLPVGRLGYDPALGYRGPRGVIFPGLSDEETRRAYRAQSTPGRPDRDRPRTTLVESSEVSWMLGCQLQLGIVTGVNGPVEIVAGTDAAVRDRGAVAVDRAWSFEVDARAELVVVGVGRPGMNAGIEELAEGLSTATRLVQRGGKIVALSRAEGEIGPALRRLIAANDPRLGPSALRGHEADPDYPAARQIAEALAWADVYLLSALGRDDVDDLALIALDRPEEARRLVAVASSCLFVSQAELTRASVLGEVP